MLSRRLRSESQPRRKNGAPPHSTAGVASTSCSHTLAVIGRNATKSPPIASASNGTDSAAATQKRRVMSVSSGLPSPSALGAIGSKAMPQIGQAPGLSRTISGCIGQVQRSAAGVARSDAGATKRSGSAVNRSRHRALQK